MKNLKPLIIDHAANFNTIVSAKQTASKTVLLGIKNKVVDRYDKYNLNKDTLELLPKEVWADVEKKALTSCYKIKAKDADKFKADIIQLNNIHKCQYCGISPIKPFDHFLPQTLYPEFSILSLNLIPCCSDCNNKKGEVWLKDEKRQFINYYFDPVDISGRFLYCNIIAKPSNLFSAEFYLKFEDDFDVNFRQIIEKHFLNLDLAKRYLKNFNEEVSSKKDDIVNAYKRDTTLQTDSQLRLRIQQKLIDDAQSKRESLGTNNWLAALIEGLAESSEFINYCLNTIKLFIV